MLTHHAYFIEGSLAEFDELQHDIRTSEGIEPYDPSFFARNFEKFGIDEARELIQTSSLKNTGDRSIFFIAAGSMTSESQQALLKLFEEPQQGTVFILLVPHGTLLPTLRSRMLEFPKVAGGEQFLKKMVWPRPRDSGRGDPRTFPAGIAPASQNLAREFLSWPYKKRSDWIAGFLKEDEDTREKTRSLFTGLELELYPKIKESREAREGLEDIQHFRQYLSDRSPSLKMILEHLAATLPTLV